MNFDRLRQLLIQKAIEGRLVVQLDNEPPVKQLGSVPRNVPFSIPKKWKWIELGEILTISSPRRVHKSDWKSNGIPFLRAREIANLADFGVLQNELFISNSLFEERKLKGEVPVAGDIVLTAVGTLGKCYVVRVNDVFFCKDTNTLRFSNISQDPNYIKMLFASTYLKGVMQKTAIGSTVKNLTIGVMRKYVIPIPPLEEQHRIVARLNELLAVIKQAEDAYTDLQSLGKTLRERILQKAIEGKLVPQFDEEPDVEQIGEAPAEVLFSIPQKWKWSTIGAALDYGRSEQISGSDIPSSAWLLDLEDIEKETGKLLCRKRGSTSTSNKFVFKKNDVLYGKLRPYLNKCIVADEDGFCTTEIVPIRQQLAGYEFEPEYIKAFLMSSFFVQYANQASYGVKMPRLGTKDAKAAPIPVPPLAEQRRIVAKLNELLPLVDQMTAV